MIKINIISVSDLANILKIGKTKTYELLNRGKIQCFRIGNEFKIPESAVYDYIAEELLIYQNNNGKLPCRGKGHGEENDNW